MKFALLRLATASALLSQSLGFEVASIKPQPWTGQGQVGVFERGNTLHGEHVVLNDLVEYAYNLRSAQLSGGPGWGSRGKLHEAELFQVVAKAPASDTPPKSDQIRQMLQALLAERFQLQVHHVTRSLPTYDLVINKGGPKLKESSPDTKFSSNTSGGGKTPVRIVATGMTIEQLVDSALSLYAGRPVFDQTGLAGRYDFTLEWAMNQEAENGASLFTALREQLGLRLEPSTRPFDTVVIDRAEKPSAN